MNFLIVDIVLLNYLKYYQKLLLKWPFETAIYKKNAKNIFDKIKNENKNISFNSKVLIQVLEDMIII